MAVAAAQLVLFPSMVNSIATLSSNIFGLISPLAKNPHTAELQRLLEKSDIVCTIELVQKVITDLRKPEDTSVAFILEKIREIISQIEKELQDVREKVNYNSSLYLLQNIRSYDCGQSLTKMEIYIAVLEKRVENLFRIIG
jgi:hypothetical protein